MGFRTDRLPEGIRLPEPAPEKETLEHYERFAWSLPNPDSLDGRFKVEDWELALLEDYFAGSPGAKFFTHLWELPTGQGKSTLLASLLLHHCMYVVRKPKAFVVGGELEHAKNTTNAVAAFVNEARQRGWTLGALWEPQEYAGGRITPLWIDDTDCGIFAKSAGRSTESKGGSSVEGKNPSMIVVEELHRHSDNGASVNTLITKTIKAAARGAVVKVVIVTTAGANRDSYLGRLEATALDPEKGGKPEYGRRPGEYYCRATDRDEEMVAHIWAVPERVRQPPLTATAGPAVDEFLGEVKKANPASWITVGGLRRIWKALGRVGRWQFLRQNCNLWVAAGIGAIDRGQWGSFKIDGLEIPAGADNVVVGLDRGYKWASTAIVPVWKPKVGPLRVAGGVILVPPQDGTPRRTSDVGSILEVMRERWPKMTVAFDRAQGGGDVAEELEEKHGITIVDHGQGAEFEIASMRLAEAVEGSKLRHDGNELLGHQVCSAIMQPTRGGKRWRGEAPDPETRIDGFDALAMAVNVALSPPEKGKRSFGGADEYRIEQL